MLNTTDHVSPNHWSVSCFERWDKMAPEQEFALIAVVLAFFAADVRLKRSAMEAWSKLKNAGHPVAMDVSPRTMGERRMTPDGVQERYSALFMHLVSSAEPQVKFGVDQWGSFEVRLPWGDVFSGDISGQFPLFLDAKALISRIELLKEEADELV